MKKISLVFFVVLMIFSNCYAQKIISKIDFEHIVDYANCCYLMTFIEEHDKDAPYIENPYNKNIKPTLQKAKISNLNNVPSYTEILKLFPKGSNDIALKLAKKINEKKSKYDSFTDDKSLLESLKTEKWENIDLNKVSSDIQDAVDSKYKIQDGEFHNLSSRLEKLQKEITVFRWILYTLIFINLAFIGFLSIKRKIISTNKEKGFWSFIRRRVLKQEITKSSDSLEINNAKNLRELENRLNDLEKKFIDTQKKLKNIQENLPLNNINKNACDSNNNIDTTKTEIKFFRSKHGKTLQEELHDDSYASFKVFNIKHNEADFEYCGGLVNPDYFEGVCSFENNPADIPNKTRINTVVHGTVKKDNNNWVVYKPAKIKFI